MLINKSQAPSALSATPYKSTQWTAFRSGMAADARLECGSYLVESELYLVHPFWRPQCKEQGRAAKNAERQKHMNLAGRKYQLVPFPIQGRSTLLMSAQIHTSIDPRKLSMDHKQWSQSQRSQSEYRWKFRFTRFIPDQLLHALCYSWR